MKHIINTQKELKDHYEETDKIIVRGCLDEIIKIENIKAQINVEHGRVVVRNADVSMYGKSECFAMENSTIQAYDQSKVHAGKNASVIIYNCVYCECTEDARVTAYDYSKVLGCNGGKIRTFNSSTATLYGNSVAEAYDVSVITAFKHNDIVLNEFSTAECFDEQTLYAKDNSRVVMFVPFKYEKNSDKVTEVQN